MLMPTRVAGGRINDVSSILGTVTQSKVMMRTSNRQVA